MPHGNTNKDIKNLIEGNERFREKVPPGLLEELKKGQTPAIGYFGCSDSRVCEGTVFDVLPGTLFTTRNIANQFIPSDLSATSVLSYGVAHLGVRHVIVMGHYGCGGVQASIVGPPTSSIDAGDGALYSWIEPIRQLYLSSTREEIVELRERNAGLVPVPAPKYDDAGFKALVEENVKSAVKAIAESPTMRNHYLKLAEHGQHDRADPDHKIQEVWIHGWVYDLGTGVPKDLAVTIPPSGPYIKKHCH